MLVGYGELEPYLGNGTSNRVTRKDGQGQGPGLMGTVSRGGSGENLHGSVIGYRAVAAASPWSAGTGGGWGGAVRHRNRRKKNQDSANENRPAHNGFIGGRRDRLEAYVEVRSS